MGVSKNNGTPKSSILIGFFHYKSSILGYPVFFLSFLLVDASCFLIKGVSELGEGQV